MSDLTARLRSAVADRYTIERELGTGGMAIVFLARDLKHDRNVAIKVLQPDLAAVIGADRFTREIHITASLSHPNILPLLDSGEKDGLLYYVMPFVAGETLRGRLDREKMLPIEDALQITREAADALSSAHSQGVVHRDIKPENILLEEGHAVVADFGIAKALSDAGDRITGTGLSVGTPGYMSPEQAAGNEVDARTDQYSLASVLFEMLGGDPPYQGSTPHAILARKITDPVPSLRTVRESVPEQIQLAVEQALGKVPADRFPTIGEFGAALTLDASSPTALRSAAVATVSPPRRRVPIVAAVAMMVAIIAVLFAVGSSATGIDFRERDWIVIADLENNTGDEVFDRSLLHALTVAIDQSQYVNVFPRNRVGEVLRRMARDSVTQIDEPLSLEVAQRENINAVLVLAISELGGRYLLSTRLIDPYTGVTVRSRQAEANGQNAVLDALDALAHDVRRDLGESRMQFRRRAVPLPRATTASLPALKFYSDGADAWSQNHWEEAQTLWTRAVELDSGFAWANASLGLATGWLEGADAARPHYERAMSLLDRVTEKERLWITGLVTDGEESVAAYQAYVRQYPDHRDAWYNLGNMLRAERRIEEAMEAYQRSLEIDSMQPWVHTNLGVGYDGLARFDDAYRHFEKAFEIAPDQAGNWRGDVNRISGFVMVKIGDTTAARERFEMLLGGDESARANGLRSLALLNMYDGRHDAARQLFEEAIALNQQAESRLSEFRNRMYLARLYRTTGDAAALKTELAVGERLAREDVFGPNWTIYLALHELAAGDFVHAQAWLDDWLAEGHEAGDNRWFVEFLRGEIALANGRPADGLAALERASDLHESGLVQGALGRARQANGLLEQAVVAFEEVIRRRELGWEPQEAWVLAHYRLGMVWAELGDATRSGESLDRFLELWGRGDPGLRFVADARGALAER